LKFSRLLLLIIIVGSIAVAIWYASQPGDEEEVPSGDLNDVIALAVAAGNASITEVTVGVGEEEETILLSDYKKPFTILQKESDERLVVQDSEEEEILKSSFGGDQAGLIETLRASGIVPDENIRIDYEPNTGFDWGSLLIALLPVVILVGLFIYLFRGARGSNRQAFDFGRSRVKLADGSKPTVTFVDVAGADEAKEELQEIVEFLKNPGKFAAVGAKIPRGVLIVGAPGTGKTLLSRAVAGEAAVPFFSISGSEFVEMFVGVGASRVRDLFDQAKRAAPCIVFVDEIDAVGRHRGAGLGGGHDEREQTLNQLLVEMDGFDSNTNIIVLSATNRPDILDPALLRPGRFDRQVVMDRPDINGRKAILQVHSKGKPIDDEVDLEVVAKSTPGFTGADLANLLNEAALLAARRDKQTIGMAELDESVDRVMAGPEKKSRLISPKEKEITAYHEAGHALVARMLPNADPVHKVSIIARGMMGGYTRLLPKEDRYLMSRSQFNDMLAVTMAGHAAEQLVFGEMTTGASNDIQQATRLARKMVTEYGMSEKLGPISFGTKDEMIFLGREISEQKNYSERVALEIDREVRALIDSAHAIAHGLLAEYRDSKLGELATRLVNEETVEGEELDKMFADVSPMSSESEEQVSTTS
jgi:cell division protease FtsH